MGIRTCLLVACGLVWLACEGESSSRINVYGAGGPKSGVGGSASGGSVSGSGGVVTKTGGFISGSGGYQVLTGGTLSGIAVRGGVRDPASTQCSQSSDGCPVGGYYLSCLGSQCKSSLASCYQVDPTTGVVKGGTCAGYAKCQMACPCDNTRGACEAACVNQHVVTNPACSTCMGLVYSCGMKANCGDPVDCVGSTVPVVAPTTATGGVPVAPPPPGGSIRPADAGAAALGPMCLQAVGCCQSLGGNATGVALCDRIVSSSATTEATCTQVVRALQVLGYCPVLLP